MEIEKQKQQVNSFFNNDLVKQKFGEVLGNKSTSFITSLLNLVNNNELLKSADPKTIYSAAMMAATLDLPINNNLGMAFVIPYVNKGRTEAQFQMGYKAFIQLAQRSGQFKTISATPIYEGQIISENPLTGYVFDFTKKGERVIGYAAYFELLNGFQKTIYKSTEQIEKHAKRFSQTYKKGFGVWKDDFDAMAIKTVIKELLSKYAPLSVDMQKAVITDQTVIKNSETLDVEHVDLGQSEEETLKSYKLQIIDALNAYQGQDAGEIQTLCKEAEINREFDVNFAHQIALRLNLTLN